MTIALPAVLDDVGLPRSERSMTIDAPRVLAVGDHQVHQGVVVEVGFLAAFHQLLELWKQF